MVAYRPMPVNEGKQEGKNTQNQNLVSLAQAERRGVESNAGRWIPSPPSVMAASAEPLGKVYRLKSQYL